MRKSTSCIAIFLAVIAMTSSVTAQDCPSNLDFEDGDVSGWTPLYGGFKYTTGWPLNQYIWQWNFHEEYKNPDGDDAPLDILDPAENGPVTYPSANQHVIMSTDAMDANCNNTQPVVAPGGGSYSFRIGDGLGRRADSRNTTNDYFGQQSATGMRYSFVVTPENAQFFYMYNVVTNDPVNDQHNNDASARFEVSVTDENGGRIDCGYFGVNASQDDVLTQGAPAADGFWRYTGWQEVPVLLTNYIGQTVTIEFRVTDCQYGAHSCYAYFDLRCGNNLSVPPLCSNLPFVDICAPDGYDTYQWEQINAITGNMIPPTDQQCVRVSNPSVGEIYRVNLSTEAGCTAMVQDTIKGLELTVSDDINLCPTESPNFQLFAAVGSAAGITYSWTSNPPGFTSDEQNPIITSPLVTTTYLLTATAESGCSSSSSVQVTITTCDVTVELEGDTICEGECTTLSANITSGKAPFNLSWNPDISGGNSTSEGPFSACPVSTTTYEVTVTDDNGAIKSATATIVVNPKPTLNLVNPSDQSPLGNTSICEGEEVDYQVTGGNTYVWSPATGLNTTTGDQVTVSPITTTNYTVIGENVSGCTDTVPFIVTINANPTLSGNDEAICEELSTTLNVLGADSYTWSPAIGLNTTTGNQVTANPDTTTEYTIIGTTNAGCKDTTQVTLTVHPLPILIANDTGMCQGESVTITATGADTYVWSPATDLNTTTGDQVIASPTGNTTYTLTGTSTEGCVSTKLITVTVGQPPFIIVSDDRTCEGDSVTIAASGASTYVWTPTTGLNTNSGAQVNASPLTTTIYTVEGADANGCKRSEQVTVTVDPTPVINVNDAEFCTGNSVILMASGADTYTWSPATNLSATAGDQVTANPAISTEYIVQGTSTNGCVYSDTAKITVNALPNISAGNDVTICLGKNTQLTASGGDSYTWTGTGLSSTTLADPIATPVTTSDYIVSGTDLNGCVASDTVIVTITTISVSAGTDEEICEGESIQLNATGADAAYQWISGSGLSNSAIGSPIASPTGTTIYIVEGMNITGCSGRDTVIITVHTLPNIDAGDNVEICNGDVTTLIASGANNYLWDNAAVLTDATNAATNAFPTITTLFTVEGTNAYGCVNTDAILVTVLTNPVPFVSIVGGNEICEGDAITFEVYEDKNGGLNPIYEWFVAQDDGTIVSQGTPSGTRQITLTNLTAGDQVYVQMQSNNSCVLATNQLVESNKVAPLIFEYPNPSILPNLKLCANQDTLISVEEQSGLINVTYEWYQEINGNFGVVNNTSDYQVSGSSGNTTIKVIAFNTDNPNCSAESNLLNVQVTDLQFNASATPEEIYLEEYSTLSISGIQASYIWTNMTSGSTDLGETITVQPTQTTTYVVDGTLNGCLLSQNVTVTVRMPVLIPDAFSPNNDGVNDYLTIMGIESYPGAHVEIFNRWGNVIYTKYGGDKYAAAPWDGRFNGNKVSTGVYYYTIELGLNADNDATSDKEPISGSFILLH